MLEFNYNECTKDVKQYHLESVIPVIIKENNKINTDVLQANIVVDIINKSDGEIKKYY